MPEVFTHPGGCSRRPAPPTPPLLLALLTLTSVLAAHGSLTTPTATPTPTPTPPSKAGSQQQGGEGWDDYLNTLFDPVFDPAVTSNVSVVEGQTAHLVCRVNNLGTKTVSWIRHRDTHILTVGSFTYTSDGRFSALHREGTNEWTLQLRQPSIKDTGLYECQVSTKPTRGFLIQLRVVVPRASILHAPELYTHAGSPLNLTCVVYPSPAPPEYIFWYRRGQVINYGSGGRVVVAVRQEGDRTVSSLLVSRATLSHSGRYQCAPSNTRRADITVHVFKAEEPAAMQTSNSFRPSPQPLILLLMMMIMMVGC